MERRHRFLVLSRNKYTRFSPQQQKDNGIFMRNINLVGSNLHYYALKRKIELPFEEKTVLVIFRAPRPCSVWVGGGVVAQRLILEHLKHTSIKFKTLRSFPKFKYNSNETFLRFWIKFSHQHKEYQKTS